MLEFDQSGILLDQGESVMDGPPFKEAVDGNKTPTALVGIAEGWKRCHRLGLGVDWFPSAISVLAPMRDETPPQPV